MLSLEIWNQDETKKFPSISDEVEGLKFGTMLGVGFSTCSFKLKRSPRQYWPDLRPTNRVKIIGGRRAKWEGEITNPGVEVEEGFEMPVECDGTGYRLATRLSLATFGDTTKGSTWMLANMLTDTDLDYEAGRIDTDDYEFPFGIDLFPQSYFAETLDKINKANGWFYGVWEDRKFHFHPFGEEAEYEVTVEDAKFSLNYSIEEIVNYLRVSYTPNGSLYDYFSWPAGGPDTESAELYRRRDGTLANQGKMDQSQAEQMATVFLNERKRMRPKTSFKVQRITSTLTGKEVPKEDVRAGSVVFIKNMYPTKPGRYDQRIINELSTFPIFETDCEVTRVGDIDLTIAPGTMGLMMEKMLARIEANTPPQY
jgi:hypothetical protein